MSRDTAAHSLNAVTETNLVPSRQVLVIKQNRLGGTTFLMRRLWSEPFVAPVFRSVWETRDYENYGHRPPHSCEKVAKRQRDILPRVAAAVNGSSVCFWMHRQGKALWHKWKSVSIVWQVSLTVKHRELSIKAPCSGGNEHIRNLGPQHQEILAQLSKWSQSTFWLLKDQCVRFRGIYW